ncbi:MAG TPA: tRNA (N(6)-L-threonylcarbamoyladenosine(37)-C(2))-methylthiotransferase MtaB [Planctomycetaceae bacterium]|nr:tRNA (N(6)-L-threonylcarbamoyladenosine(37)-C(2))-methylthiotransferase MtaB [Planctomycetaceae bacterium]HQZ64043.1 tRNA (N(6)-L-threonylcarbamoyladenosine(37)-C(2))-methylthiotransferase MtaB [Planctomycetaceae bacterium]
MSTLRTCRLITLGCKVNQYETQLVREALLQGGFREATDDESADLCVVNTCTVTNTGDSKSRQIIRQLSRQNPGTKTIVMGCYATRDPQSVSELPNVIEVVTDKRELPDVLGRFGIVDMPNGISEFEGHQRAFVKIQDGCILKCSYCIIPTVRPGLRSRRPIDIEEEMRALIDHGYREIVISGIHMGHFGVDTNNLQPGDKPERLWHLLRRLDRIPGEWRMRLSSIESVEINDDFIKAVGDCEHLCPQFHPALQSGSNTVLTRMRRRYRVERFLERLDQIRDMLGNDPAFSTDIIVGFPSETDAEFEETLETCRKARFMKVHVFPFSRRDGTPAATMPDQVPPEVIKERVRILSDLERTLAEQFYLSRIQPSGGRGWTKRSEGSPGVSSFHSPTLAIHKSKPGTTHLVLVEGKSKTRPGYVQGSDQWYIPVEVPGTINDVRNFVSCRPASASRDGIVAERLSPPALPTASRHQTMPTAVELDPADSIELVSLGVPASGIAAGVHTWPR